MNRNLQWVGTGRRDAESKVLDQGSDLCQLLKVAIEAVGEKEEADDDLLRSVWDLRNCHDIEKRLLIRFHTRYFDTQSMIDELRWQ